MIDMTTLFMGQKLGEIFLVSKLIVALVQPSINVEVDYLFKLTN